MERLTNKAWRNLDPWECCGQGNYCKRDCHEDGGCNNGCIVPRLYSRLGQYEDTGLYPENISSYIEGFERNKKMAFEYAKRLDDFYRLKMEGRLVALPCKPGEMVWRICGQRGKKHVAQRRVESVEYTASGEIWIHSTACDVFGKTVFLTREEAEAFLKGEYNAN